MRDIPTQPVLRSLLIKYKVRGIPSILLFRKRPSLEYITTLRHRQYNAMEEWIQKTFYPQKDLLHMQAAAAVYELRGWLENPTAIANSLTQDLFTHLTQKFDHPYFDEFVLMSYLEPVFSTHKPFLRDLRNQVDKLNEASGKQLSHHNEKIRNLLLKEMYHYLLKSTRFPLRG